MIMDTQERTFVALVGFQQELQRKTLGININNEHKIAFSTAVISDDEVSVDHSINSPTKNNVIKSLTKKAHDFIIENENKRIDMFVPEVLMHDNIFNHFARHNDNLNIIEKSDLSDIQQALVEEYTYTAQQDVQEMIDKYYENDGFTIDQIPHLDYEQCVDIAMRKKNTIPFYVATDATMDPMKNLFFVSCVTQNGEVFTESLRARNIAEAESFGVRRAIERYSSRNVNLVIFTDSQSTHIASQKLMNRNRKFKDEQNKLVNTINERNKLGHLITVEKVKGHSGHILNTAADDSVGIVRKLSQGAFSYEEAQQKLADLSRDLKKTIDDI